MLPILEFIHGKQVIHWDIKPENIIRRKLDNQLFLVDFGAAKFMTPLNRSVTGTVIGSAEYVAPEQGNGKAVNASDLYSLGVSCIYLLTGISPFDLFDVGEHEWIWRQYLVNNPIGNELGNILDNLIEFGTKRRYQSASEVLQAMNLQPRVTSTVIQPPVTPVSPSPVSTPSPILQSARGIDYQKLEDLLKRQQWQEADEETAIQMLQVANRTKEGWLRIEDIDNFPCEDLRTIDRLWVHYSKSCFGFSVQGKRYRSLGGTREYNEQIWEMFGKKVGWRVNNSNKVGWQVDDSWIHYDSVTFDLKAPLGHLPTLRLGMGSSLWGKMVGCVWLCGLLVGWFSLLSRQDL
jgi:serine/threonine protein kinase